MVTLLSTKIKEKIVKKDQKYCRICADETCAYGDKWTKPCKCKGSIEWVHLSCLKTWIKHSNKLTCDMCLTPYQLVYNKQKEDSYDSTMNLFYSKIAPLSFTIFLILVIFDISYGVNYDTDGITAFLKILKTYTYFMLFTVVFFQLYFGNSFNVLDNNVLEAHNLFGTAGIFFSLPHSIFRIFKEICSKQTLQSSHNEIIDVINYD